MKKAGVAVQDDSDKARNCKSRTDSSPNRHLEDEDGGQEMRVIWGVNGTRQQVNIYHKGSAVRKPTPDIMIPPGYSFLSSKSLPSTDI